MDIGRKVSIPILIMLALCLFVNTGTASAEAERVYVRATKLGRYDFESQVFIGEGDVELRSGDTVIHGDYLVWDMTQEELYLNGNVTLVQGSDELRGQSLKYNVTAGKGELMNVRSVIDIPKAEGPVFLFGESMEIESDVYRLVGGKLTTCDLEESHYHVSTKELEVIVGKKMIIRGVTYYEGKMPLFYWPYLVIPLDVDWKEGLFALPVVGYNQTEGIYVKNTFNYYINQRAYGNVYVDFFSKLGIGLGVRHLYDLGKVGNGSLYVYHLPHKDSQLWRGRFEHETQGRNWELKTNNSYEDSMDSRFIDSQTKLTWKTDNISGEARAVYQENPKKKVKRLLEYGAAWKQTLADGWQLHLDGKVTERDTTTRLKMIDYLAETSYAWDKHTVTLGFQQKYNPDLVDSSSQPWVSVNRIPEVTWNVKDLGPLRLELSAGKYSEYPSQVTGLRGLGALRLQSVSWKPTSKTTLSYTGDLTGSIYEDQESQLSVYGRANLSQRITDQVRFSAVYSQRNVWGDTPFQFDRQKAAKDLTLQLNYASSKVNASVRGGYDFLKDKYDSLVVQSRWQPNPKWRFSVYANYDLNTAAPGRLVPILEYEGDSENPVEFKVGGRYEMSGQYWERMDVQFEVPVAETWKIGCDAVYEPQKGTFSRGALSLSKVFHCRTIAFSYDHVRKNVALQYTINAFPTLPFKWGSATGVSLFDLEDVYDIIGL